MADHTIRGLEDGVWGEVKILAAKRRISIKALINGLILRELRVENTGYAPTHFKARWSRATETGKIGLMRETLYKLGYTITGGGGINQ